MASANGAARAGVWLLVVGGLTLAVSTFLDWYDFLGAGVSAWDALRRTDVAVFVAGLVAAASGAWLGFGDVGPERRVVAPLGAAAGMLGAVAVIVRMASPPGGDVSLEAGIYIALVAAVVAAIGGVLAVSRAGGPARPRSATRTRSRSSSG
jgi:hypothetical protein